MEYANTCLAQMAITSAGISSVSLDAAGLSSTSTVSVT